MKNPLNIFNNSKFTGILLAMPITIMLSCNRNKTAMESFDGYLVPRLKKPMAIDGKWDKQQWRNVEAIKIARFMGEIPGFKPDVSAKMMYDDENLYVIFQVADQYVRCLTNEINGPVWEDACVEFFFSPDTNQPERYFNLEVNCGGTPLMHYNLVPRKESIDITPEDISTIEIAHSMPAAVDPEIKEPVTWTLEYRIPLSLILKYSAVTQPAKGVTWKANFYKIAENNSNPHYITWNRIENPVPDFHLPKFFGCINFY